MIENVALAIVVLTGLFQITLAIVALLAPERAVQFLGGFASSPKSHYTEMLLRLVAGSAFVINAPAMLFSTTFVFFGWVLIGSTVVLMLLPWRWHQQFAKKFASPVIQRSWLIGVLALPLGIVILYAALK